MCFFFDFIFLPPFTNIFLPPFLSLSICLFFSVSLSLFLYLSLTIYIYIYIYIYTYMYKLATVVEGEPRPPFAVELSATPYSSLFHFNLDAYLIILSVKQGDIKYHFYVFVMTRTNTLPTW